MKKVKGIAVFAAALMALNSATVVFANESGKTRGIGSFEGNVSDNVFNVELPTLSETNESSLGFILDPNDLIGQTNAAKYSGVDFDTTGSKGFYFKNTDADGNVSYSSTSDKIKAVNKSNTRIDVSLEATVSDYGNIQFSNTDPYDASNTTTWAALTTPTLSLALKNDAIGSSVTADTNYVTTTGTGADIKTSASKEAIIPSADANAFTLSYTEAGGYKRSEKAIVPDGAFKEFSFYFKGATGGKWTNVSSNIAPKLDLVWNFEEHLGNIDPYIEDGITNLPLSRTSDTILTLNYGAGLCKATTATVTVRNDDGSTTLNPLTNANYAVLEDGVLTFKPALALALDNSGVNSGTIILDFDNGKKVDSASAADANGDAAVANTDGTEVTTITFTIGS